MSLQSHVNNSGFPLQIAIAQNVRDSDLPWRVLYQEHYWKTDAEDGFIDLAIENLTACSLINIECKRVRDSHWTFLLPKEAGMQQTPLSSIWWTETNLGSERAFARFGWHELLVEPLSHESSYCIVPGQDSKSRPLLERVAAQVANSTYGLAVNEAELLSDHYSGGIRFYLNAIVTTASLQLCTFDPAEIDIATGDLGDEATFEEVPFIRFRKQLGALPKKGLPKISDRRDIERFISDSESTVFVINSRYLTDFLSDFKISAMRDQQWR